MQGEKEQRCLERARESIRPTDCYGLFSEDYENICNWLCNPKTKAEIKIPATKVPEFAAGKAFNDAVSSKQLGSW